MSLEALNERVKNDLAYLSFGGANWVRPREHADGHVYDVVIVGGGQSGLGAAFGLLRERISNIVIIDEKLDLLGLQVIQGLLERREQLVPQERRV